MRFARLLAVIRNLVRHRRAEADLTDEIGAYLDLRIEESMQQGATRERARREALVELGGVEQVKEQVRHARAGAQVETLCQDVRYGGRMLRKYHGVTVLAVLTLAMGIGASTAIFSVVNAILLRPLPFPDASRLVMLQEGIPKIINGRFPVSAPDVLDFRRLNHTFDDLGAFDSLGMDLSGSVPERVSAARTSAAAFRVLGVAPEVGRTFADEEDAAGHRVVILSHALWQSRYGGDLHVVGREISLNRQSYSVIGVMPPGFEFPVQGTLYFRPAQVWVPIAFSREELDGRGDNFNFGVLARLKPAMTLETARADLAVVAKQISLTYPREPGTPVELEATLTPFQDLIVGASRPLLLLLLGAVSVLLLIACANVANLLLARGSSRQQEIAVRAALGAARSRLVRQLLIESALLGFAGGAAGLVTAYAGVRMLVAAAPSALPRVHEVGLDVSVLAFTLAMSLLSGLLFGVVPAITATRADVNRLLKGGGRGTSTSRDQHRLRNGFVVAQIALALLLVIGSGLLIRSLARATATDPGFQPDRVLALALSLPPTQYPQTAQVDAFFDRLVQDTAALPGVTAVATSSDLPLNSGWTKLFTAEGRVADDGSSVPQNAHTLVDGPYFSTLRTPLLRGRGFTASERRGGAHVIIISDGMARRYWPGENPVGRRLKWGASGSDSPWLRIVGVAGDVKQGPIDAATMAHTYEPFAQACAGANNPLCNLRYVLVRSETPVDALVGAIRGLVRRIDPEQPIARVQLMTDVIAASLAPRRFNTLVLGVFAAAALLLAAIGVYGVMAYAVSQRTREIGVRLALGASPREIMALVLSHGAKLAVVGVAVGVAGSLALTRLITSLLFNVGATDLFTFVAVSLLLGLVSVAACYVPARRAMRVNPLVALPGE